MTEILKYISIGIGIIGVAVITWGVLLAFTRLLALEFRLLFKKGPERERENLRHQLGSYLMLGLEFLIAADIIATITHPTLNAMAVLAAVVVIRTLIGYFLGREVEEYLKSRD